MSRAALVVFVAAALIAATCPGTAMAQDEGPGAEGGKPSGSSEPMAPPSAAPPSELTAPPPLPEGPPASPAPAASPEGSDPDPGTQPSAAGSTSLRHVPSPAPDSSTATQITTPPPKMVIREGDVIAGINVDPISRERRVKVMKVVKISWVYGNRLLHCLTFKQVFTNVEQAKEVYEKRALEPELLHLPVDGEGMQPDANKVLANEPVTPQDLVGYNEYIKEMGQ